MDRLKEVQDMIFNTSISLTQSLSQSLGPRGSDKMIVKDKKTLITNDGATILSNLASNSPVHKILSELSQAQDKCCGDGTTSVVVLTGSILKCCKQLLKKNVHQTVIFNVLDYVKESCNDYLESIKIHIGCESFNKEKFTFYLNQPLKDVKTKDENKKDLYIFRDSLLKSVVTALSSKIISTSLVEFSPVAVDSVLQTQGDITRIKIIKKKGGSIEDVRLTQSIVLNNMFVNNNGVEPLKRKMNVALLQFCISPPKTNMDAKISIDDHLLMENVIREEREYILNLCKKIHLSGAEAILIQKSILKESLNELALHFLTKLNILIINDVDRDEIEFLSKILDLKLSVDSDCIYTKQITMGEFKENETVITEIYTEEGCSIILRGSDELILDEAERSLTDAIGVVKCLFDEPYLVPGGGAVEMGLANKLNEESLLFSQDGEIDEDYSYSYIYHQLSAAFEEIPCFLARNAGMDSFETINRLREEIKNTTFCGINVRTNQIGCMFEENIVQPIKVTRSIISNALETVGMLIKIDDILPSKR